MSRFSRLLPRFLRGDKPKAANYSSKDIQYYGDKPIKDGSICKILFLDDTEIVFSCKGSSKGAILLDKVYLHLNIVEKDYFGLRYLDQLDQTHWLDTCAIPYILYFGVKFYPADPCKLKEEITRYQFYLQVKRDILHGRLPLTFDEAAELFAYGLQSELGDFDPKRMPDAYVSEFRFVPNQTEVLEDTISAYHRRLMPRINKVTFKGKIFVIKVRDRINDEHTYAFELSTKVACKHLWKCCIEHHAFFRLNHETDFARSEKSFRSVNSSRRSSGRQDRLNHSDYGREQPDVLRVPSRRHPRRTASDSGLHSRLEGMQYMVNDRPVTIVAAPEHVKGWITWKDRTYRRSRHTSLPDLNGKGSPRSTRSAPWNTNADTGMYTSGRDSPTSMYSDTSKFPNRRGGGGGGAGAGSDTESGYRRKREVDSGSESDISPARPRARRPKSSASDWFESQWRDAMTGSIPSIHSAPAGEAAKRRRRRRTKSPSSSKQPPAELKEHIQYGLVDPVGKTEEELKEIPYTKVETKAEPFKIKYSPKTRQRYRSPKRKSFGSDLDQNNRLSGMLIEEPPPPYTPELKRSYFSDTNSYYKSDQMQPSLYQKDMSRQSNSNMKVADGRMPTSNHIQQNTGVGYRMDNSTSKSQLHSGDQTNPQNDPSFINRSICCSGNLQHYQFPKSEETIIYAYLSVISLCLMNPCIIFIYPVFDNKSFLTLNPAQPFYNENKAHGYNEGYHDPDKTPTKNMQNIDRTPNSSAHFQNRTPVTSVYNQSRTPVTGTYSQNRMLDADTQGQSRTPVSSGHSQNRTPVTSAHNHNGMLVDNEKNHVRTPVSSAHSQNRTPVNSAHSYNRTPVASANSPNRTPVKNSFDADRTPVKNYDPSRTPVKNLYDSDRTPVKSLYNSDRTPVKDNSDSYVSSRNQNHDPARYQDGSVHNSVRMSSQMDSRQNFYTNPHSNPNLNQASERKSAFNSTSHDAYSQNRQIPQTGHRQGPTPSLDHSTYQGTNVQSVSVSTNRTFTTQENIRKLYSSPQEKKPVYATQDSIRRLYNLRPDQTSPAKQDSAHSFHSSVPHNSVQPQSHHHQNPSPRKPYQHPHLQASQGPGEMSGRSVTRNVIDSSVIHPTLNSPPYRRDLWTEI
ncbi:hypothetical protein KUTeg_022602 [Tegillarca granosa]|uniref:FERM domain-containing protein n=1 Tax=Tegillarca granosa TaxID=220873 RepID=A0ABQ9E3Z7_TEGGR|nr:hypothetical protein KUTeg_022602 [Tegillarca granosa]